MIVGTPGHVPESRLRDNEGMMKNGGTQRVVVQYQQVNVGDGGRALVAGQVGARTPGRKLGKRR